MILIHPCCGVPASTAVLWRTQQLLDDTKRGRVEECPQDVGGLILPGQPPENGVYSLATASISSNITLISA